jgi:MFS family permease
LDSLANRILNLLRNRALLAIFIMIFLADTVSGIFYATFSLYAAGLGATLTLIGLLGSVVGLTRIVVSVPIGLLSDSRGRRIVLLAGMFLFVLSSVLYAFNLNPYLLIAMRVLTGIAITATFFIGMAYVGDVAEQKDQGLASGIYTTCMGLGFSAGSVLGGALAAGYGYQVTYLAAAALATAALLVGWRWLAHSAPRPTVRRGEGPSLAAKLALIAREPHLLAASLGNMFVLILFDAAVASFFPLYAETLFISQATIGAMFALRALASAAARLPTGVLTTRFGSDRLMVGAMILGAASVFSLTFVRDPLGLTLLLLGEGICYGMFMTAGQVFINERVPAADRGTAIGIYATTGAVGSMVGPFLLGAAAERFGLPSVFWISALMVVGGIALFLAVNRRGVSYAAESVERSAP